MNRATSNELKPGLRDVLMNRLARPAIFALALACAGCSAFKGTSRDEAMNQMTWDFANDAVIVEIAAQPNLNQYGDEAHTLLLGVYQMSDAAPFRDLSADPVSLAKAMESGKAGTSFLQFSRYVVSPGQHSILILDRAQQAKYIGVTAGYYRMGASTATRLFDVPVKVTSKGWVSSTYSAVPAPLIVRMNFGAETILNSQNLDAGPAPKDMQNAVALDGGGKEIKLSADDPRYATAQKTGN